MDSSESDAMSKKRPRNDQSDDDDQVGPMPTNSKQKKVKNRNVQFHSLYLEQLPNQEQYEKSYMHKFPVTHIAVTKTDFIVTTSSEGQVKFWKKEPTGIRLYQELRAHIEPIKGTSVSYDGLYFATCSVDKSLKVYDVKGFDMTCILSLDFTPSACAWVYRGDISKPLIAVSSADDPHIRIFNVQSFERQPKTGYAIPLQTYEIHKSPVSIMKYNVAANVVVSIDSRGIVEHWDPQTLEMPTSGLEFKYKSETDYITYFAKHKTAPLSMEISNDGELVATMSADYHIRIFKFATGKVYREYDESLATLTAIQKDPNSPYKLEPIDFGRRMAIEKMILEKADSAPTSNVIFDHSGTFIMYPTLLGIKLVNIKTNKLEKIIGRNESNERYMGIALYQGKVIGSAYMDNLNVNAEEDPTIFACAFKKNRFFMFSRRLPDERDGNGRDVINEKPTKEELRAILPTQVKNDRRAHSAVIHTTFGDIHLQLFKDDAPKAVENFTVHSKRGYFNGLIFHRVVKDFVIQTGDPFGDGTGGSSIWDHSFEDEITRHRHDQPGVLSMANSGPNTNGSQFFITTMPAPHLDGKHTVFGKVTKGMDVVRAIEKVKVDKNQKPLEDIKMINIDTFTD